jgi:hypothetical protein
MLSEVNRQESFLHEIPLAFGCLQYTKCYFFLDNS